MRVVDSQAIDTIIFRISAGSLKRTLWVCGLTFAIFEICRVAGFALVRLSCSSFSFSLLWTLMLFLGCLLFRFLVVWLHGIKEKRSEKKTEKGALIYG